MQLKTIALPDFVAGDVQLPNWGPLQLNGPLRTLVLPDLHIPFHEKSALMLSVRSGRQASVDTVLVNGDCADYYDLSKFCKDPRARRWPDEIKMQRDFFVWLRCVFPKARILYKLGNHDERYETFLMQRAPELIGLDVLDIGNLLRLREVGVELVRDKKPIRLGNLNVIHGHEYRFAISNPVNAARGLFLRTKAYALCSHFHQSSYHSENNIEGSTIATWSTGCLCDLHPAYMPINNWSHGFAIVEVDKANKFHVRNRVIRGGEVY